MFANTPTNGKRACTTSAARVGRRVTAILTAVVAMLAFGPGALPSAHAQDTYVVDASGDTGDSTPGNETCDDGSGNCTLRAAIEEANNDGPDRDIIEFSIPSTGSFATITPSGELTIQEPVIIDGTTANGYPSSVDGPVVEINGSSAGSSASGLSIQASDVTIRGLGINEYPDDGIQISSSATSVLIDQCFVGIAIDDGESNRGNGDTGILVFGDGFTLSDNVISHNGGDGVYVNASGAFGVGLKENMIGLDWNGDAAAGNGGAGVTLDGGESVRVGWFGLSFGSGFVPNRNYIGANDQAGIFVNSSGHFISANRIGTDSGGTTATGTDGGSLGNGGPGISVYADTTSIISNVISGNASRGGGGNGITVGADNALGTVDVDSTVIRDNVIGLNLAEDAALPNGDGSATSGGIVCKSSPQSGSGQTTVVEENRIAGNSGQGIRITSGCFDWQITDNFIGTNGSFASGLGNEFDGVAIQSSPGLFSGEDPVFVDENVIASNGEPTGGGDGIDVRGESHILTDNFIGVAPDGSALPNAQTGIRIDGTTGTSVDLVKVGTTFTNLGNDSTGTHPTPAGSGNVIGFHTGSGVYVEGDASGLLIVENYVGTNSAGADLGNSGHGVRILDQSSTSTGHELGYDAGDTFSSPHPASGGRGNVIAFNDAGGISVGQGGSSDVQDVSARGNVIYQNGGIGIDLNTDGTTGNDNAADDGDTGPNQLQNFPVIEDVTYNASTNEASIDYRVQTTTGNAAYPLDVDFYAADSEASGEGKVYLGSQVYQSGDATTTKTNVIDLGSVSGVTEEDAFVATATDANGNTSEFVSTSTPLPVEIASFEATQSGDSGVELTWTTASETNNAGFRVQHQGPESETWSTVGFVESRAEGGTTSQATSYRFTERELAVGRHQFRLEQVDLSGTTHLHEAVTIDLTMDEPLTLTAPAPNPVRSEAQLSFAVREATSTSITVYNVLGQKVKTLYRGTPTAGESTTVRLNGTDLTSGVYFVRVQAGQHTRTQRMTVVQ